MHCRGNLSNVPLIIPEAFDGERDADLKPLRDAGRTLSNITINTYVKKVNMASYNFDFFGGIRQKQDTLLSNNEQDRLSQTQQSRLV